MPDANQQELPASVAGVENGPGIVFVHGTTAAGAYWHAHLEEFTGRFQVVTVDLPGHGSRRAVPFSHREAIATILGAIARCRGGEAVVVGHSLGGYLSMDACAEAPDRFKGLVLVGCTAIARGAQTLPYQILASLVPLFPEEWLFNWHNSLLRHMYQGALVDPLIAAGSSFGAAPAALRSVFGRDHLGELAKYSGPVLILNGERDFVFRTHEQAFLQACQNGRLRHLARAGHMCNYDVPAEFTAAVREFASTIYGL